MNVLYIGDIMAEAGIKTVATCLPDVRKKYHPDIVIAQAENVTNGKSISREDMVKLQNLGIDFFTGGNHTPYNSDIHDFLKDPNQPIIGPANMTTCPGKGWKIVSTAYGDVLVVSLLGATVGREVLIENPLQVIDDILEATKHKSVIAKIVNFHGDYSSEKRIIGYYLDGRVSLVVGDHWHVPTADAMVLPQGTAHITDVGMCGTLHSSLGVSLDSVVPRWKEGKLTKNQLAHEKPWQFNALIATIDTNTGLAKKVQPIQEIIV